DRNRSHWSTSKTPSYTKSVSWQHHPCMMPTAIRIILLFIKLQWLPAELFRKFSATKPQVPGFHLCLRFLNPLKKNISQSNLLH
ncbi:hypothetical protein, partial [Escherichia coli]